MTSIGITASLVFIAASAAAAPSSRYAVSGATVTQIADLGGAQSMALDINDDGYIAGWSEIPSGARHALYNIGGVVARDLSAMYSLGRSEARGINNSKHVVGSMTDAGGNMRAFRWYGGSVDILDHLDPTAINQPISSDAVAIADNGYVVGHRNIMYYPYGQPPLGPVSYATLWTSSSTFQGLMANQSSLSNSFVHDVNSAGQTVGREESPALQLAHRWDWSSAGVTSNDIPGAVTGISHGDALGINDAGAVVGWDIAFHGPTFTLTRHAIFWNGSSLTSTDLGVLPGGTMSVAEDVDDANFVAGYGNRTVLKGKFQIPVTFESGFIYHAQFGMYELPKLASAPWGNCRALALNERRAYDGIVQVVGYCESSPGVARAVRWDVQVALVRILPPTPFPSAQ
jgi:uncharacterized membrane protein